MIEGFREQKKGLHGTHEHGSSFFRQTIALESLGTGIERSAGISVEPDGSAGQAGLSVQLEHL